jgi:hypothetical protein
VQVCYWALPLQHQFRACAECRMRALYPHPAYSRPPS